MIFTKFFELQDLHLFIAFIFKLIYLIELTNYNLKDGIISIQFMSYTKTIIRGVSWVSGLRIFTRIFSFLKIAILARILSPQEFGIFGIASLALVFVELLTETGVNVFIVQTKKNIEEYIDSAWIVSITRGIIISTILLIFSPIIASFFKAPSSLNVLYLISIAPFVRGFINPSTANFQKNLKFNVEFVLKGSVFAFDSIVSIFLALITHSVFSLVWGLIAGAVLELILSFIISKPRPKFKFKKLYLNEIFHKGKWVTVYGLLNYAGEQGDNVIVGKILGSSALGIYQMAYKISYLPISEISDVVNRVVFPVYTKIESDKTRLINAFKKTTLLISALSISLGFFIFIFPKEIVLIILGEKWITAVPILRILALYGVIRAIYGPSTALFLAVGKQKYITVMTFVRFLGLSLTIYPFIVMYGIIGAAYSVLFSVLVEIPVILHLIVRIFREKNR